MVVNGWHLFYFKLFAEILNQLEGDVLELSKSKPDEYLHHPKTKLLAAIAHSIEVDVPSNPADRKFLLGKTLGKHYGDWRRVKRGLPPRYRLFFKFASAKKHIIYAWLNDENTLRKEGDKNDVYAVFASMLKNGTVPDSIDQLMQQSSSPP